MNLRFLLFCISFLFIFPLIGQNNIKWSSWDNISDRIGKSDRKFLVYLFYDGCKWCRYLEETTFDNDHIAKFINQNYYPFRLNARSDEKFVIGDKTYTTVHIGKYDFNEIAAELLGGYMSFPAIAFLDERFNKIQTFDGYIDVHDFEMILSYYAGNHHKNTIWKRYANNYCRESYFNSLVNDKNK